MALFTFTAESARAFVII